MLNKNTLFFCSLFLSSTAIAASDKNKDAYVGLNSTQIGIQNITYEENLANFAEIGDLSTEISVSNTVIFASSYTSLSESWGILINSQSNLTKEYTKDNWSVEGYGPVQSNTSKLNMSDLSAAGVFHYTHESYFTLGGQVKTIQFVRSNFEPIDPAASDLNSDIRVSDKYFTDPNPPQIVSERFAIEEDLTYINFLAGVHYNSAFAKKRKRLTYSFGANLALPLLNSAQNSALEQQYGVETIDGSFNGYEFRANAGISYELKKGIALTLNTEYMIAHYDEINTGINDNGIERTAAIPDVDMSSLQVSFGVTWIN